MDDTEKRFILAALAMLGLLASGNVSPSAVPLTAVTLADKTLERLNHVGD